MLHVSKSHLPSFKKLLFWGIIILAAVIIAGQVIYNKNLSRQIDTLKSEVAYQQKELSGALSQRCSTSAARESNTTTQYFIDSSGGTRSYGVHTPSQYGYNTRTPVVIVFSGKGGTGTEFQYVANFDNQPVISVYPEPLRDREGVTAWQGAPYSPEGVSDVYFVGDIIKQISKDYCIDPERIYTIGMSNGGGIAWLSACYLSETIAATASISGAYYKQYQHCPTPSKNLPVLAVHSKNDTQVPYTGNPKRGLISVSEWVESKAKDNACAQPPRLRSLENITISTWEKCSNSTSVELVTINGEPHGWMTLPQLTNDPNVHSENLTGYVWEFLREYKRQ